MPSDLAVIGRNVSKRFRLYHERPRSLKERLVNLRGARFEEFWALDDVSFEIAQGESYAIVGANGSGKSTLLKCLAGILRPERGEISTHGRMASLLELGAGFHPDLTGRENVFLNASILGLTKKETERSFDEIVDFAELESFIDMQVKHYSSGMYVRLGFAVAVHVDPEILLVDEVLAVGDERFQRKCLDRIAAFQKEGRTIVLVTHAMDMMRRVATRAMFLDKGKTVIEGPPLDVIKSLRQTLHGESHTEADIGEERGNRRIQILRVVIADGDGAERHVFRPGDDLQVIVDLEAAEPVDDVMVGIGISDDRDLILGTNSEVQGRPLGVMHGKTRIRFVCRNLPMQDRRYLITVGVTSKDSETVYHWQERFYSFICERTGLSDGILDIPVSMEVEPL